jgi:hypothetical protein
MGSYADRQVFDQEDSEADSRLSGSTKPVVNVEYGVESWH